MFWRAWEWVKDEWKYAAWRLGGVWAAVEEWLVAHRQGFEGFVLGLLVAGLVVARMSCGK